MFIYVIVNSEKMKLYIGQHKGNNLRQYLHQKLSEAHRGLSKRSHLYAAMRKYPRESWSIWPLVSGIESKQELDDLERHYIRVLKAQHSDVGYNICRGGEGHTGPCPDHVKIVVGEAAKRWWASTPDEEKKARNKKVADAQRGVPKPEGFGEKIRRALVGKKQPPETIAKRVAKLKNPSPETREKQSRGIKAAWARGAMDAAVDARRGVPRSPEVMANFLSPESRAKAIANTRATNKGKPKTPETRAKMSEGKRRSWAKKSPEQRHEIGMKGGDKRRGRKLSPETCARMSASMKGRVITWGDKLKAAAERRFIKTIAWG